MAYRNGSYRNAHQHTPNKLSQQHKPKRVHPYYHRPRAITFVTLTLIVCFTCSCYKLKFAEFPPLLQRLISSVNHLEESISVIDHVGAFLLHELRQDYAKDKLLPNSVHEHNCYVYGYFIGKAAIPLFDPLATGVCVCIMLMTHMFRHSTLDSLRHMHEVLWQGVHDVVREHIYPMQWHY
jgi:hypothetical protein